MKKLRIWSIMMLVIMALPFIASCGDDEDNNYQNTDIAITGSCKEIGSNYALVEGYFNQKNITASYSSIKIGIEYSDDESFKYSKFIQSNVLEGNKFEVTLTGLNPSTIYYYRTCIKVNEINNVGKTCKFTTNEVEEKDSPEDEGEGEGEGEGTTTAYFAYQNPVRTLVLGNDIYDNSLDKAHKCRIWATVGGQYNGRNATVNFVVDPTLCDNLWFVDERGNASYRVTPMPTNYYTLSSNTIPYNGDSRGYVEVQFSDAFFNDANSVRNTYVIPLRMTNVTGIDNILTGTSNVESPIRTNEQDWSIQPKDYVLYCVKYMNPWQAKYYRRGVDVITEGKKEPVTIVRKDFTFVEPDRYAFNPVNQYDEECGITTKNMTQAIFPVTFWASGAYNTCKLILTFDGNCCTISTEDEGVTVTGFGEFITKGTERQEYKEYQWESKGRNFDILRLAYNVNFENKNIQVSTNDTLVVKTRESNKKEFFNYMYIK